MSLFTLNCRKILNYPVSHLKKYHIFTRDNSQFLILTKLCCPNPIDGNVKCKTCKSIKYQLYRKEILLRNRNGPGHNYITASLAASSLIESHVNMFK